MAGMFSRAMFQIGARRFVLEFRTSVTELHPVDTQVIPIATRKPKQKAKRGPASPLPGTPRRIDRLACSGPTNGAEENPFYETVGD